MNRHGGDVYRYPNVLDFSANINYMGMPQPVKAAAMRGIEEAIHYPQPDNRELICAISDKYKLPGEYIVCGNGAAELIYLLVAALVPERALVMVPTFSEYEQALEGYGCEVLRYLLHADQDFEPDEGFIKEIEPSIDMVFLCNPNNPTGGLVSIDYIRKVLKRCESVEAVLVIDESFLEFVPEYESSRGLLEESDHLFILQSFTKMYAMPGLRLGCAFCSNQKLMDALRARMQPWNISLPAQYAGIAALQETKYVENTQHALMTEREYLIEQLRLIGLETSTLMTVYGGAANFLLFRSVPELWNLCMDEGVMLRDCSNFAGLGAGWYRTAVRSRQENTQLVEAIRRACMKLQSEIKKGME